MKPVKVYKYIGAIVLLTFIIACTKTEKVGESHITEGNITKFEFTYWDYFDCSKYIWQGKITTMGHDSIRVQVNIDNEIRDETIRVDCDSILNPFIYLSYLSNVDDIYPFNGFIGNLIFPRDLHYTHDCKQDRWEYFHSLPSLVDRPEVIYY